MNANFKSGFVTLIGRPNVGKSTLMSQLIGQKLPLHLKNHRPQEMVFQTVIRTQTGGRSYLLDTPGIHKAKNKLGEYMVTGAAAKTITVKSMSFCPPGRTEQRLSVPESSTLQSSCAKVQAAGDPGHQQGGYE